MCSAFRQTINAHKILAVNPNGKSSFVEGAYMGLYYCNYFKAIGCDDLGWIIWRLMRSHDKFL